MRHFVYQLSDNSAVCGAYVPGNHPDYGTNKRENLQCPFCMRELDMRAARTAATYLHQLGFFIDYSDDILMGISKEGVTYSVLDMGRHIIPEEIETCMKLIDEAPEPVATSIPVPNRASDLQEA